MPLGYVFTRVNNEHRAEKFVLDYVIVSSNLSDIIVFMTIDKGKAFTPWRNFQRGKRFTDHNAISFELQWEGPKVMTSAIGTWSGIFMVIRDGKSFVSSKKITHPFFRYGKVAIMFRSITKTGKVFLRLLFVQSSYPCRDFLQTSGNCFL